MNWINVASLKAVKERRNNRGRGCKIRRIDRKISKRSYVMVLYFENQELR